MILRCLLTLFYHHPAQFVPIDEDEWWWEWSLMSLQGLLILFIIVLLVLGAVAETILKYTIIHYKKYNTILDLICPQHNNDMIYIYMFWIGTIL